MQQIADTRPNMSVTSEDEDGALLSDNQSNVSDASSSDNEPFPQVPFSQHTFAPPFYGRPPTPLPPSPSLTSLLRPSRPTTPDQSDDEHVEPLPRQSPKVPTYEYYGFVVYLLSSLIFLMYLLWSALPSPFLHALGIYYYPDRWWALALPSFLVMLVVYVYVALAAYNTEILTLPLASVETIVDDAAMVAVVDAKGRMKAKEARRREERRRVAAMGGRESRREREREREAAAARNLVLPGGGLNWRELWNEGTDGVMDVPLAGVCEVLYGEGRDRAQDVDEVSQ
jgi:phosphatidylinositol N-acetylglucosaminyltransferase subunit P